MRFLVAVAVAVAVADLPADAVTTRTWRVSTYKELDEGEASGVLLSSLGDASSGFGAARVDVPEAEVFSSAVAPDGTGGLGTGDQAQLYTFAGKTGRGAVELAGLPVPAARAAP